MTFDSAQFSKLELLEHFVCGEDARVNDASNGECSSNNRAHLMAKKAGNNTYYL